METGRADPVFYPDLLRAKIAMRKLGLEETRFFVDELKVFVRTKVRKSGKLNRLQEIAKKEK